MADGEALGDVYFLGGQDLEMVAIRNLLKRHAPGRVVDARLAWGAAASAYAGPIGEAIRAGRTAVLVELTDDLGLAAGPDSARVVVVDHHNERAGGDRPTSLEQVFGRLGRPPGEWTRWKRLVAANDKGHIAGMLALGAGPREIAQIRAADRAAQGITPEQEAQGREAAGRAESTLGGQLTVVRIPHDRTATVTDALDRALGGAGFENLLILGPSSTSFFGSGELIERLRRRYPDGYFGGALPSRGYWGHSTALDESGVVNALNFPPGHPK